VDYTAKLDDLIKQTDARLPEANVFPDLPVEINLLRRPDVLLQVTHPKLRELLTIDEAAVRKHFQEIDDAVLQKIYERWSLRGFDLDAYLSVPFFIKAIPDTPEKRGEIRFVVHPRLFDQPTSTRTYYRLLLQAYAAMPAGLKVAPSAWSHGLASLVAQDMTWRGYLAACPDLQVETAIVALLIKKDENLVWDAFPGEDRRFDKDAYLNNLKRAIAACGSENPDEALKELLRSPEEYNARAQAESASIEDQPADNRPIIPPLEPPMRILWMILPSTEAGLRATIDGVNKEIKDVTLRFVLLNACYDKLCAVVANKTGLLVDAPMLLRNYVEDSTKDLGAAAKPLLPEFEQAKERVWQEFEAELGRRKQDAATLPDVAYDTAMLKWAFRFFYNYSLSMRQAEKQMKEALKKEQPLLDDFEFEKAFCKQLTPEMVRQLWQSDEHIRRLLAKVGDPALNLRDSAVSQVSKTLECCWHLKRSKLNEDEELRVKIVDTFSSGGGKPIPGVFAKAKVVVRKNLKSPPEVIELGTIRRNYYVQSVNTLSAPAQMVQDWARVLVVDRKPTRVPWDLESGAAQPLLVGQKQYVRALLENEKDWKWQLPMPLHAAKDNLLGIRPEGVVPEGQTGTYSPSGITASASKAGANDLITISICHREIEEVKESGAAVWGYFANGRMVQAPVYPALEAIDGLANVELPDGEKKLEAIVPGTEDEPKDKVNAFRFGSPKTFKDIVLSNESKQATYVITIQYKLPNGRSSSLRVAEGQVLVTYDPPKQAVAALRAYQLKVGSLLVCAFTATGPPVTATVTDLIEKEESLGVYKLKLRQCPLVRVNGVLAQVDVEGARVVKGVEENSAIQLAPPDAAFRQALTERIDLAAAESKPAKEVKATAKILCYNTVIDPRSFWWTTIAGDKTIVSERHIRLVTPNATLICGHLQKIYVTSNPKDLRDLSAVPAMNVTAGQYVVWLATAAVGSKITPGTVRMVPVTAVEEMHPTKDATELNFRQFIVADTRIARLGLRPTMFANGIMVEPKFEYDDGEQEHGGGAGQNPGIDKIPAERGSKYPQPGTIGALRDLPPQTSAVRFTDEDLAEFTRNRASMTKAFAAGKTDIGRARGKVINAFLCQYFASAPPVGTVLDHLNDYLADYCSTRDFLIQTGNVRVLPAVVNAYVFLSTLAFEAGTTEAGDALTQDFLCLITRTIEKPGGSDYYAGPDYCVRQGLLATRDILLYVRHEEGNPRPVEGFEPITKVTFPATSFKNTLINSFVKAKGCSEDICDGNNVNLYNLCRQLDRWSAQRPQLFESIVCPGFQPRELFMSDSFRKALRIESVKPAP
jgi:hypothetical protein